MTYGWHISSPAKSPTKSHSCVICTSSTCHLHVVCGEISALKYFQLNSRATALLKKVLENTGTTWLGSPSHTETIAITLGKNLAHVSLLTNKLWRLWTMPRGLLFLPTSGTKHWVKGSKYTILTTHLYTCVIIIHITFFYIYFNEKHCILIYYCSLIFSFQFFIMRNFIWLLLLL